MKILLLFFSSRKLSTTPWPTVHKDSLSTLDCYYEYWNIQKLSPSCSITLKIFECIWCTECASAWVSVYMSSCRLMFCGLSYKRKEKVTSYLSCRRRRIIRVVTSFLVIVIGINLPRTSANMLWCIDEVDTLPFGRSPMYTTWTYTCVRLENLLHKLRIQDINI